MPYRNETSSHLDRGRHPALFQRVSRTSTPQETPEPQPSVTPSTSIYAAFVEFVQFRPVEIFHREERIRHASAQVWHYLDASGFSPEDIQHLKLGLYTTADDVRQYLRSVGFSETAIAESGLVTDERETIRHDWHASLIVPLTDERGKIVDVMAVIPTSVPGHPTRTEYAARAP